MGGVVDEHVDAAEFVERLLDQLAAMVGRGDVAGDEEAFPSGFFDKPLRLRRVLRLVEIRDRYVGAFARESQESAPVMIVFLPLSLPAPR